MSRNAIVQQLQALHRLLTPGGLLPLDTNKLLTIRKAISELDVAGVTATGIILNPADWESIETLTTVNGEFLLPLAPQQSVERVLWKTPVTLAAGMPAREAIIGDLSTVSLLYRNSQRIEWTCSAATRSYFAPKSASAWKSSPPKPSASPI